MDLHRQPLRALSGAFDRLLVVAACGAMDACVEEASGVRSQSNDSWIKHRKNALEIYSQIAECLQGGNVVELSDAELQALQRESGPAYHEKKAIATAYLDDPAHALVVGGSRKYA